MIVNIRVLVTNLFYRNNINNEQYRAKNRALWNTMYVNIMRRQRGVNLHRRCSRLNKIHKPTVYLNVYTNFIKSNINVVKFINHYVYNSNSNRYFLT